jgi:hypothetical protein
MRTVAAVLTLACSGCIVGPLAIGAATLAPAMAPVALAGDDTDGKGQGGSAIGYVMVGADHDADVAKGWGLGVRSDGFLAVKGPIGFQMYGRTEVGAWGRDRIYGLTGLTLGPGVALGKLGYAGVGIGYEYGGYPQIGHLVPVRGSLVLGRGAIALRATAYEGWRFGIRDEWPAETDSKGPGWNAWGGDVMLMLGREGIAVGVGWDHEDNLHLISLLLSASLQRR